MNFQSLKWMIDSLINSYKCPGCTSTVNDSDIDIIWAAWTTINIDIECFKCWRHSMIKTEVLSLNLTDKGISAENIDNLKKALLNNKIQLIAPKKTIKDEEIVDLNKDLKKNQLNVSDLLGK